MKETRKIEIILQGGLNAPRNKWATRPKGTQKYGEGNLSGWFCPILSCGLRCSVSPYEAVSSQVFVTRLIQWYCAISEAESK
jgi:hypothetical protein